MYSIAGSAILILLLCISCAAKASTVQDGYIQIQIPPSYWVPLNVSSAMTLRDCAFECTHLGAGCMAFAFEDDSCQLAEVTMPQDGNNFIPSYISDADAKTVMIKKKHIDLHAMKEITHLAYFDQPNIVGAKYGLVMDDKYLMEVNIASPVQRPYFAVIPYKRGLISCGGFENKTCRFWSFVRKKWTTMRGEPEISHYDGASCIFDDRLWLFGGRTLEAEDAPVHRKVDSYDLINQRWRRETEQLPDDLKGSYFPAMVIPEKAQALLIGGRALNGVSYNDKAYIFSFTDGSYSEVGTLLSGTCGMACAFVPWSNGQKILCGGGLNIEPQDKSYIYDVETRAFNPAAQYKLPKKGRSGFITFKEELYLYEEGTSDRMFRLHCNTFVTETYCNSLGWRTVYNGGITNLPNSNFVFKIDYHEIME